jgi:DNA polymerase III subunit delta'
MTRLPPWLDATYTALVAGLDAHRLPHALLIHGPGGWGETVLAEALALRLIERGADAASASTIAHPDLRWIVPEGAGEQIGIDAIRALADFVVHTPQIAPRKAAVITSAEAMNGYAANALLKTLEEPPPDSYLILVSDSLRDLLPTLRSRCRLIPVRPPTACTARAWIRERAPQAEPDQIAALGFEYGDAPYHVLAALERGEQPIALPLCSVAARQMDPLRLAEAWAKDASVDLFDRWMRYLVRALGIRRRGEGSSADPFALALAGASDPQLLALWEQLARDRQLLRGTTNPNVRLLFETRLLAWRDLTSSV